jgi:tetratricopeptide (TPR) repeat protein
VAKINPVKLKQDADKLEKAGKLDQAIGLYRQITEDNPRDWNTINKVGDLYAKLNKTREATVEYAKVADFYAKDGFYVRAIAMWKKINKLDASALEPYTNLAELYAKQGLMTEAKSHFQMVVDEYVKRGKTREAGDVLKKLAEIDPADLKIRSKLADLYTREGNSAKAVEEHVAIAEELNKKGHLAEALQVLEKGLKIDANSARLKAELGRVHLVQKNYDKAVHFLEEASRHSPRDAQVLSRLGEAYLGAKRTKEAESTFKRALELDPQDQEAGAQMARVHLAQGQFDQAYAQLLPVVNRLVERREGDRGAALLQQIVQKNPSHVKTLVKLVEIYGQLGKESAAATAASHLTEAYINQGQFAEAATLLEGLLAKDPENQQHRSKLQMVRARLGGGKAHEPAPPAPSAPEIPAFGEEEELDLSGSAEAPVFAPASSSATPPGAASPARRAAIEASGPLSEEDQEFVEEHLAEGKVFRKYGLLDKAADQFEAVIARFPDNLDARQELRDVYKEKEQPAKAAEQSLALAEIFRLKGDAAAAQAHEAEARKAAPELVAAAAPAAPAPKKAAAPPAPPAAAPEPQPELELEEEEVVIEEEAEDAAGAAEETEEAEEAEIAAEPAAEVEAAEEPAEELSSFELTEEAAEPEATAVPLVEDETAPDVAAAEEVELSGADEEEPAEPAAAELALESEELALEEPEPEPAPAPPPPPAPLKAAPVKPAPPPPAVAPAKERAPSLKAPAPPPPAPALPADLQKVLDEVDSYVSLGFVEDAVEALQEIGARYAEHPALLAKIAELGLDRAALEKPAQAPVEEAPAQGPLGDLELEGEIAPSFEEAQEVAEPPVEAAPPEPEPFVAESAPAEQAPASPFDGGNLETELDELFGAQAAVEEPPAEAASTELGDAGLADIFKEFKKGVDKQLGKEDYDTRYNLGIAYKEMGLIDEAIAEFQLAAKDENRTLECSSMLGICFMEKGMPKLAVKWFEKGLKAEGRTDEEYQGLRYDLAMAHEAAGEMDKALHLFTELYGQNANFRDVAAKVRDLRAALR